MNHNDIRHKLSEYLDGAVPGGEKAEIEEHLKACRTCSDALEELRKTIETVRQIEETEPPAWMTSKIMARVRAEAERKKSFFQRLFYPLAIKVPLQTVAVLFLLVTAFYIYRSIQPEMQYTETPAPMFEAKKEAPSDGKTKGAIGRAEEPSPRKQAPQSPEYKSLDMKYAYEKPAPPVPKEEGTTTAPAAPAPAKPTEQPASRDETEIRSFFTARTPESVGEKGAAKAKGTPAVAMMQEQASRSRGLVAKEETKHAAACLSYEPAVMSVRGIIGEKEFPVPPNYERISQGDRRETIWILTLDNAVCVAGKGEGTRDEASISEIQLVLDPAGYAKYHGLLTKPVVVRGTLFHAHTGHHRTRVLLTVLDIAERK
ncbi:MAG TPA: DUF2275 domain-containing protein [Nitrospirota bacterium]|nr:DUF2275 domain-containing protein [Nitrospirota bacterium]